MYDRESPVLVDTNAIIEAHRTRSWRALSQGRRIETVDACVVETQTGYQLRRKEEAIDASELRESLAAVHSVGALERAELALRKGNIALDEGEKALWAHALARNGIWVLCSPDKSSLRCGVRLGYRERLVSLEELFHSVGHRPATELRRAYTKKWHDWVVGEMYVAEWSGRGAPSG